MAGFSASCMLVRWGYSASLELRPVGELISSFGRMSFVPIQAAECGLPLACCLSLRTIRLSLSRGQPPIRREMTRLFTIASTQPREVSLSVPEFTHTPDVRAPELNFSQWNSLDIVLCDLARQYQPRHARYTTLVEPTTQT